MENKIALNQGMENKMTLDEFKAEFVAIIDHRLNDPVDGLHEQLRKIRLSTNTKYNQKRIEWIMSLIQINEDWKGRLKYGRFYVPKKVVL